jgi:hypothetical protein
MHQRSVESLSDGRRFLLGDAAHLSSPLGGEGLNSAFMDAADIAWKLALVLRGGGKPSLLDSYAIERGLADRHVLEVSNETHNLVMQLVAMCADGCAPTLPEADPAQALIAARKHSMLDVSYAGSPLVGHYGAGPDKPAPGERFPACCRLKGGRHYLMMFGKAPRLDDFRARWATSSPSSMLQARLSTRPRRAFRTAAPFSCGRTASSVSAPLPQTTPG